MMTTPATAPSQPFRKCHLHVLRSLYSSEGQIKSCEGQGIGAVSSRSTAGFCSGDDDDDDDDDEYVEEEKEDNENNAMNNDKGITLGDVKRNRNDNDSTENSINDSDIPVDPEIWSHIERFLLLRAQYRPHKEHQLHWSKVYAESNNRLQTILSATSSIDKEDGHNAPLMLKPPASSLTPRTPLFATYGRGGSITPSLSLTPVSSNRKNATKSTVYYDNRVEKLAATLPAWNFIHQMLHRRSRQSIQSCTSFRSQPFLTTLLKEAEMRCNLLKKILHFQNSTRQSLHHHGKKRRKLESAATTSHISLGNFFLSKYSSASLESEREVDANVDEHEDFTTCAHMKFHLWACLLSSVTEIVVEGSSKV